MSLAVFWIVRMARDVVEANPWLWNLFTTALALGAVLLFGSITEWYASLAIAALASFWQYVEDLLATKADEAKANVLLSQRRR